MNSKPNACTLTDSEFRQRRDEVLHFFQAQVRETRELNSGIAFRFDPLDTVIEELSRLIRLERMCCPFLRFNLVVEPETGPVWLEVTGPQAKQLLKVELGL